MPASVQKLTKDCVLQQKVFPSTLKSGSFKSGTWFNGQISEQKSLLEPLLFKGIIKDFSASM